MIVYILCAVLWSQQYGISQVCENGKCRDVRGALTLTETVCYLKLDSTYYTFAVDRIVPDEGILQIHGGNFTGFILLRTDHAILIVTPHDKRLREKVLKLVYYDN